MNDDSAARHASGLAGLNKKALLLFGVAVYAVLHLIYLDKYPLPWGDEFFFTEPSWQFLSKKSFATVLHPDIGFIGTTNIIYGRVFLFINVLIFSILDYTLFTLRLQPYLMGMLTLWLTFKVTKESFASQSAATLSTVLLGLSSFFVYGFHSGRPEMTIAMFTVLTLWLFTRAQDGPKSFYFLAGLTATLAVDCHPPSGIVPVAGLLFMLAIRFVWTGVREGHWNWKMVILTAAGMLVGTLWWVTMHKLIHPELYAAQMEFRYLEQPPMWTRDIGYVFRKEWIRYVGFFWNSRYHRNMILFLFLALSLAFLPKWKGNRQIFELFSFVFGGVLALLVIAVNSFPYYLLCLYPLFCILIGLFLSLLIDSGGVRRMLGTLSCLAFGLFYIVENGYWIVHFRNADYPGYIARVKKLIPNGSVSMVRSPVWWGFRNERSYSDQYLHVWSVIAKEDSKRNMGRNFEEIFDNFGIEYYQVDEDRFYWEDEPEMIDFLERRARLVGTVEDEIYGRGTFYPGTKRTRIYRILRKSGD